MVQQWRVAGIVLCGGESRRMGKAKAWLPFGNETVLQRIVRCVSQVAAPVVVVKRPSQTVPSLVREVLVVEDAYPGLGPLAGIHAGLLAVREVASHALVLSCDVPLVSPAFLQRLIECMREAVEAKAGSAEVPLACVPALAGQRHPLVAVYSVKVLPLVESLLREGRLRPAFLLEQIVVRWLEPSAWAEVDAESVSLTNINTPEEYQAALRRANLLG